MKTKFLFTLLICCALYAGVSAQCNVQISYQQTQGTTAVTFTADSVSDRSNGLSGSPGFSWSFSDGSAGIGQQITHQFNLPNGGTANYTVCVTMSDSLTGCHVTTCDTITVYGDSSNAGGCVTSISYTNQDSLYTFSTTNQGTAPYTYLWTVNGQSAGTGAVLNQVIIDSANATAEVCVVVSDSSGCTASSCVQIFANPLNGNCNVYAVYTHQDSVYTFFASTIGVLPAVYQWSWNNTLIASTDTATLVLDSANLGNNAAVVCVTMTDANGCVATSCVTIADSVNVTGNGPCQAYFAVYADTANGGSDTSGTYFCYNLSTGNYGSNILWNFGDGTTSTDPYPTHNYAQSGLYIVCLTVGVGGTSCYSTYCDSSFYVTRAMVTMSHFIVVGPTGISEVGGNNNISIYPDPVSYELNIATSQRIDLERIYNVEGQKVFETRGVDNKINVSNLPAGAYVLELTINGSISRTKFVKD